MSRDISVVPCKGFSFHFLVKDTGADVRHRIFFKLQYNPLKLSSTQTYLKSTCVYSIVDNISKYLLCAKNIFNTHVKQ